MWKLSDVFLLLVLSIVIINIPGCSEKKKGETIVEVIFPDTGINMDIPVAIELPEGFDETATWTLAPKNVGESNTIYTQIFDDVETKRLVFLLNPGKHEKLQLVLHKSKVPAKEIFTFTDNDNKFLTLYENESPVMTYVYGMNLKEGVPEDRTRSGYIHPVYGLDGEILTEDFPVDHYHHRGIYIAWPRVIVDGDSLDLWHIRGIEKRFERWLLKETGPVYARLGIQTGWYKGENKVVDERLFVTVYRVGTIGRIMDFQVTFEALYSPVKIIGSADLKGYGGFNYRPATFEEPVITAEGETQADSDLKRFAWADFSARFGGRNVSSGTAIFEDKRNINTPNGWCIRHYGFLGIEWPGNNPYILEPGTQLMNRYRIWFHRGNAEEGSVDSAFSVYENPPKANITEN
ncbi:MAG: PmoA family protein [Candidatus Latescibacteria bacterium]|nr:PmoA family protein [Candidatus Latescibacterota bacterium]